MRIIPCSKGNINKQLFQNHQIYYQKWNQEPNHLWKHQWFIISLKPKRNKLILVPTWPIKALKRNKRRNWRRRSLSISQYLFHWRKIMKLNLKLSTMVNNFLTLKPKPKRPISQKSQLLETKKMRGKRCTRLLKISTIMLLHLDQPKSKTSCQRNQAYWRV